MTYLTTAQERLSDCAPWECPVCGRDHGTGDDSPYEFPGTPVAEPDEIHHAAHCCLWKDYDHAARVRIAERVEAGATWADAIEGEIK